MSTPFSRQVLFISHALPEDNEFVLWLSARLKNEGYNVWCELNEVHGGEHFWKKIEPIIRDQAAKFIFVASQLSVGKEGVRDEWDFARSVAREQRLQDFIIPINLDGINSNALIGMTGLAMLQFQNSWAAGLKALVRKLERDNVPKQIEYSPLSVAHWLGNRFGQQNGFVKKEETFYSNWLDFPKLPEAFFIHEYSNKEQANLAIRQLQTARLFPVVQHERYVIAFAKDLPDIVCNIEDTGLFGTTSFKTKEPITIAIDGIIQRTYRSDNFPIAQDASNFMVQILRECFHKFLESVGLKTYHLANKKLCYYYEKPFLEAPDVTIKFDYQGKPRSRQLTGKYFDDVWHYGISFNPRLRPYPCISFKGHILFSNDGHTIWDDKKKLHSARRKKGKRMFNAAWRDLWLAFLNSLSEDRVAFAVPITEEDRLWLTTLPVMFSSNYGYEDPYDNARIVPIDDFDDEQDADDIDDFLSDSIDGSEDRNLDPNFFSDEVLTNSPTTHE